MVGDWLSLTVTGTTSGCSNTSTQTITITPAPVCQNGGTVNASCGCTTPSWEKDKTVNPGEKTNITVGYNAAAEGPFTKFITVTYNDTQSKQITIKGEVWKTPGSSAPENKGINDLKN